MKSFLALLLVAVVGVNSFPFYDHDYERTELGNAIDKASLKLLKEAYTSGDNKNVIASPLGIMILLALFSGGAGPMSQGEITQVLGGTDLKQASHSYSELSKSIAKLDPNYLTLANKIYVQNGLSLNEKLKNEAALYDSAIESLNFQDPKKAADVINAWSNEKTKGHISAPVSEDAISPDTVVGLFNVIFFQGHWHVPFKAEDTKDEDFHVDKNTVVKKPTMHLTQSLFYTENNELGAKMIELPYKEEGFRMVVVLPNEIDGLQSVLEKASEKGLLEDVFKLAPSGCDVNLHIPKFEIKTKHDLNDILPKVGVSKIFNEAAPGIVDGEAVKVSKAFQEAFVKVDEEGATAGAFTGVLAFPPSASYQPPQPIEVKVDHPFLFLILHEDKIIFSGVYSH